MAELITLLLAAVASLLSAGASPDTLAAKVRQTVLDHPPVPIEDVQITVVPAQDVKPAPGQAAPPAGSVQLTFDFTNLYLEPLMLKHAVITVGGVKPAPGGKVSISSINFTARITDGALTDALKADTDALGPDPQVRIDEDGVALKGSYSALVTRIPFEVKGNLSVQNQTQLMFTIDKSKMAGMPVPSPVNKLIQHEVNPVYDLAKFHQRSKKDIDRAREQLNYEFHLLVQELKPQAGYIIVTGTA
jgi:hypothetical protein